MLAKERENKSWKESRSGVWKNKILPVFFIFLHRLRIQRKKNNNRREAKFEHSTSPKKEKTIRFHIQNTLELAYQKIYQLNQRNENWFASPNDQKEKVKITPSSSSSSDLSCLVSGFDKIPLVIHQTYKSLHTLPERWKKTPESWQQTHPNWEYKFWSDQDCRLLIEKDFYWFLPFYDSYPHFIQRVDAWRFFVLYKHGGVYVDMDLCAKMSNPKSEKEEKKNLSELFDRVQKINGLKESPDMFLLQDPFGYLMDEHAPLKASEFGFVRMTNCFIASKPRHPLLLLGMKLLCERALVSQSLLRGKKWWSLKKDVLVLHSTGPGIWTELYRRYRFSALTSSAAEKDPAQKEAKHKHKATKTKERSTRRASRDTQFHKVSAFRHQQSLSFVWRTFFCQTVPDSFSSIENSNTSEMRLAASLSTTLSQRPDHVAVIPSSFFFPVVCYFLSEKPCSLPSTYAIQLEGHSWIQSKWDKKVTNYVLQILFWFQTVKNKELSNQILEEIKELEEYQRSRSAQIEISSPVSSSLPSFSSSSLLGKNGKSLDDATPTPSCSSPFFSRKHRVPENKQDNFEHKFLYLKRFLSSRPVQAFLSQKSALLERRKEKNAKTQCVLFSDNRVGEFSATTESPVDDGASQKREQEKEKKNPAGIHRFLSHYQAEPLVFRPFRQLTACKSLEKKPKSYTDTFIHLETTNAHTFLQPLVVDPEQVPKEESPVVGKIKSFANQHNKAENKKDRSKTCGLTTKRKIQKSVCIAAVGQEQNSIILLQNLLNEASHTVFRFLLFWSLLFWFTFIKLDSVLFFCGSLFLRTFFLGFEKRYCFLMDV